MEPEQPPADTYDHSKQPSTTTPPEEEQHSTTPTPRSYECNFCKRGFTNAQALGGHMNIHRKDKAKFKHSSSSSTGAQSNLVAESPSATRPRLSPTTTTTTTANPFSISHQGNWFSVLAPQKENKPLPFFKHEEVPRNVPQPENPQSPPPPEDREVDLELRLGHVEPPEPESSSENKTTATRKFF